MTLCRSSATHPVGVSLSTAPCSTWATRHSLLAGWEIVVWAPTMVSFAMNLPLYGSVSLLLNTHELATLRCSYYSIYAIHLFRCLFIKINLLHIHSHLVFIGKASFDAFSHKKPVLVKSSWPDFGLLSDPFFLYPPWNATKIKMLRGIMKLA